METTMGDFHSWEFEGTTDYLPLSFFTDEIGSGFNLDSVLNQPVAGGLWVAGVDSDSDSGLDSVVVDFSSGVDDSGFSGGWDPIWDDDQVVTQNPTEDGSENLQVSVSSSLSSISAREEISSVRDLEWEFLLGINNDVNEIGESILIDASFDAALEELGEFVVDLRGGRPAAKRVVENLPLVELREEHFRDGVVVCAVCGDEVVEGDMMNRLPCGHYYHGECIVPWLKIRNTCPVCRYELPINEQENESRYNGRRGEMRSSIENWTDFLQAEYSFEMFNSFQDLKLELCKQFSSYIGEGDSNLVQAVAVRKALELSIQESSVKEAQLVVESDSSGVVINTIRWPESRVVRMVLNGNA